MANTVETNDVIRKLVAKVTAEIAQNEQRVENASHEWAKGIPLENIAAGKVIKHWLEVTMSEGI